MLSDLINDNKPLKENKQTNKQTNALAYCGLSRNTKNMAGRGMEAMVVIVPAVAPALNNNIRRRRRAAAVLYGRVATLYAMATSASLTIC